MNLFFWKNNGLIDSFASELADELFSNVNPDQARLFFEGSSDKKQMRKSEKKLQTQLSGIIRKINEFKLINTPGIYGKARLHLKFKLRLEELGYDRRVIDKLNETLMLKTPHL
jgi:hypothetical protein